MPPPVTLDALAALCQSATPGPWTVYPAIAPDWYDGIDSPSESIVVFGPEAGIKQHADAEFIAAARAALPALIEAHQHVLALHHPSDVETDPGEMTFCDACGYDLPCPTVRALTAQTPDTEMPVEEWHGLEVETGETP